MQAVAQLRPGAGSVCWLVAVPGGGDQTVTIMRRLIAPVIVWPSLG
jgi:hypothetical protein